MSHALFYIVPLMIGVFGGTVSAIVVIKNVGNQRVAKNLAVIEEKISEMVDKVANDDTITDANNYKNKVKKCRTVFDRCTLFPIIIFAVWIILISLCVSMNSDCKKVFDSPYDLNEAIVAPDNDINKKTGLANLNPDPAKLAGIVVDGITNFTVTLLLSSMTIFLITIANVLCIIRSLVYLRLATTQTSEIAKIHKTVMQSLQHIERNISKTGGS